MKTNKRQRVAEHMLQWHGGMGSGLYALGSHWHGGHEVTRDVVDRAIAEIDSVIRKEVPFPETISAADIRELEGLKKKIMRLA